MEIMFVPSIFSQIRAKGFRSLQFLEKDLHSLYQIQLKYLEKMAIKNNPSNIKSEQTSSIPSNSKQLDKLVNQMPIGVFRPSQVGEPMRLYYYLSPLDLIQHHQNITKSSHNTTNPFNATYQLISSSVSDPDELIKNELGSFITISLMPNSNQNLYSLPDSSLLLLNEKAEAGSEHERAWSDLLNPYLNVNFNFTR